MSVINKPEEKPDKKPACDSHRLEMIRIGRAVNARAGITGEPTMTAEQLQQELLSQGIRPEDNILSRELMRMRYGDDWEHE